MRVTIAVLPSGMRNPHTQHLQFRTTARPSSSRLVVLLALDNVSRAPERLHQMPGTWMQGLTHAFLQSR